MQSSLLFLQTENECAAQVERARDLREHAPVAHGGRESKREPKCGSVSPCCGEGSARGGAKRVRTLCRPPANSTQPSSPTAHSGLHSLQRPIVLLVGPKESKGRWFGCSPERLGFPIKNILYLSDEKEKQARTGVRPQILNMTVLTKKREPPMCRRI